MNEATSPTAAQAAGRTCRNCGTETDGAYCPNCGQETTLALPTVRSMLRDAAGRYVALDGRMWRTLFALVFRPGFLTREYFAGRRKRYIRPARLFLVLSIALFALLRFEGKAPHFSDENVSDAERAETANEVAKAQNSFNIGPDLDLHLNVDAGSCLTRCGGAWPSSIGSRAAVARTSSSPGCSATARMPRLPSCRSLRCCSRSSTSAVAAPILFGRAGTQHISCSARTITHSSFWS
jgi:rRNA maturation protein Nop10